MTRTRALQALLASGVPRDRVFLTSKIHPRHLGFEATLAAFQTSLRDLHTDFVDLLLLHYPACWGNLCEGTPQGTWQDSWRAMEQLVRQGQVLALGVLPCSSCGRQYIASKRPCAYTHSLPRIKLPGYC